MSYYMGDYYRGDPGIGSFFSGLVKKAVGFIPGVGPIASAVAGAVLPGGAKTIAAKIPAAASVTAAASNAMKAATSAIVKHPVLSAAGAAGALAAGSGAIGMHMGKASAARAARAAAGLPPHKRRRMNACNPRALRRAARRLHSFAKHYKKAVGFVSPHPKKGRMYFKSRKKKG